MKHVNVLKRLGGILLCAILMLTLSAVAVAAEDEVKDVSEEAVAADSPVLTIGADDVSDFSENVAPSLTIDTDDATSEAATDVTVLVTIADANGDLVLAMEPVTVIDIDEDGLLTINDALYCAHEEAYEGGAAAGYASAMSDYGLSLAKLWGTENGSSYGYYVNDAAAWGLADPVADGDRVNAFVYTDLTAWSDTYCYFDVAAVEAEAGDKLTLTLTAAGYDESWNPITLPVAGATITINGEKTDAVTDENGQATVTVDGEGTLIISAVSETQTLVPPVCVVELPVAIETGDGEVKDAEPVSEEASEEASEEVSEEPVETIGASSPDTGDAGSTVAAIALFGALCAAGLSFAAKRRDK